MALLQFFEYHLHRSFLIAVQMNLRWRKLSSSIKDYTRTSDDYVQIGILIRITVFIVDDNDKYYTKEKIRAKRFYWLTNHFYFNQQLL